MFFPTYDQCTQELEAGNVFQNVSPCGHYVLFNYRPEVEFKNLWNDVNIWCRGIVYDVHTKEIAAVPFRKFWNVGQKPETSEESLSALGKPVVMSKEDGSLGILFWNRYARAWQVCTRGSFTSDQAVWATNWIRNQVVLTTEFLSVGETHLFEIVYPENKIVSNYGEFAGLIYLNTVVWNDNDNSCYYSFGGERNQILIHIFNYCRAVKFYDFDTFSKSRELLATFTKDQEGFVLLYPNGLMAKMKGAEYLRVHKIRSSLTIASIASLIKATGNFQEALSQLPDEFWGDYLPVINRFEKAVRETGRKAYETFYVTETMGTRKEKAEYVNRNCTDDVRRCVFLLIDGKESAAFNCAIDWHVKNGDFNFKSFLGNNNEAG